MRTPPAKQFAVDGLTVKLYQDEDASNPREKFDHFGSIVHWHRRYNFGEYLTHPDQWFKDLPKGAVVLSIALLDHSGLHIWCGSGPHWSDAAGWDSGQVGWIYATPDAIRKEYSCKRISAQTRAKVEKVLRAEVEEFDQYLRGDVYGYVIEDDDGNCLDSCWGFFGHEYAEEQAREAAQNANKNRNAEACLI